MVRKLIILGIDGMDWDVIVRYKDKLPNLYGLMQKNNYPHLRSVFPADTTPAWSTIYTGLDPSEHGIINFVNVGAKENTYKPLVFDDSAFKGKTFWDVLNKQGLSCAVILPMNIKEGWEINGLMITRPYEGKIRVYPQSKESIYNPRFDILGTDGKFTSEKDLPALRDEFFAKVNEEIRLTRLAIENEDVDVLFSYFSTTDGIQHDFWRHCDPNHPEYPGPNEHEDVIRDMYIAMDNYVGEVMQKQPDTPLLIISDHGHGARPVYTVRINELLRRGLCRPKREIRPAGPAQGPGTLPRPHRCAQRQHAPRDFRDNQHRLLRLRRPRRAMGCPAYRPRHHSRHRPPGPAAGVFCGNSENISQRPHNPQKFSSESHRPVPDKSNRRNRTGNVRFANLAGRQTHRRCNPCFGK